MPNQTPGVYIEEINPFPNSIVAVDTTVPAFIGFTEKVNLDGQDLTNVPYRIESLLEFEEIFGKGHKTTYSFNTVSSTQEYDFQLNGIHYAFDTDNGTHFFLYAALKFFYENGGGSCYIISVGKFSDTEKGKHFESISPFTAAIDILELEKTPAMLVIPDAVLFNRDDCYHLQEYMLLHCGAQKNRIAILDIHQGYKDLDDVNFNPIDSFRNNVNSIYLGYGAAYFPWLNTNILKDTDINFENLNIENILKMIGVFENYLSRSKVKEIKRQLGKIGLSLYSKPKNDAEVQLRNNKIKNVHKVLIEALPDYKNMMTALLRKENILPPSAAMAGIYASIDIQRGVWKAPANVTMKGVIAPTIELDHAQNNDLNAPTSGRSICAIRTFTGKGTLVWGARTLDGNNYEWKYIPVRRTMIMIEQSINNGLTQLAFMPNTAATWSSTKSMISNFLNNLWRQGALAGSKPSDGFFVRVGLGSTMTASDILDGVVKIEVGIALNRPAEFMVIRIQQQTQSA